MDEGLQAALASVLTGRALVVDEAASYVGLAPSTLNKLRVVGGGPAYVQAVQHGAVRYRIRDLDEWMADRTIRNTSQVG